MLLYLLLRALKISYGGWSRRFLGTNPNPNSNSNPIRRPGPGGTLEVLDHFSTAAAWAHRDTNGGTTAILRLVSFRSERLEFHTVYTELAALNAGRLVIDLRGNGGGHICHAMELAYLVSSKFPKVPKPYVEMHKSDLTLAMALNQSVDYDRQPTYMFRPDNFIDETDGSTYKDSSWFNKGDSMHTDPVPLNCDAFSSLMDFKVAAQYGNTINLKTHKLMNYDKERLVVLVDNQCSGACATFAKMMKMMGAATTVKIGPGELGSFAGGMMADSDSIKCQFNKMGATEPYTDFILEGTDFRS